jgi:hypothetical protein
MGVLAKIWLQAATGVSISELTSARFSSLPNGTESDPPPRTRPRSNLDFDHFPVLSWSPAGA